MYDTSMSAYGSYEIARRPQGSRSIDAAIARQMQAEEKSRYPQSPTLLTRSRVGPQGFELSVGKKLGGDYYRGAATSVKRTGGGEDMASAASMRQKALSAAEQRQLKAPRVSKERAGELRVVPDRRLPRTVLP